MLRSSGLAVAFASALALGPAAAIQYSDGTVGFSSPPRLSDSYTTRNLVGDSQATYYLTVDFPAAAAEPLARIEIRLREGFDPLFRYRTEATQVFANTATGPVEIPLGSVSEDRDARLLVVSFDPPLPPGTPITLALRPVRNPRFGGVYLFGATAYPVGDRVEPTFLGYARLSFYERDRHRRWP